MAFVQLSQNCNDGVSIMIFAEGTIFKPKTKLGLFSFKNYVPVGNCVGIISRWREQGAQIFYCTSRKGRHVGVIAKLLERCGLPGEKLYYRDDGETYKDIVEAVKPDVLIEDDCKSIGGARQMCITHVSPEIKKNIKSVVVSEFGGIDHLEGLSLCDNKHEDLREDKCFFAGK